MQHPGVKKSLFTSIILLVLAAVVFHLRVFLVENFLLGYNIDSGSDTQEYLVSGGLTRSYIIHLPQNYGNIKDQELPLFLMLHGAGSNAEMCRAITKMNDVADEENFLVVYPNGTGLFGFMLTWNAGYCCNYVEPLGVDDVAFLESLILKLEADYNIDPLKIYIAGFSNGGMMAYRIACETSDKVAAIASVSSTMSSSECNASEPVSIINFHGTGDTIIPYFGGSGSKFYVKPFVLDHLSVDETISFWLKRYLCLSPPQKETKGRVEKESYVCGFDNIEVVSYIIEGAAHVWPGGEKTWLFGDAPFDELNTSEIIWDFFKKHPKNK